ncbi:MAG: PIN domain-containing protein [Aeromicrobium sp.]|uniref:TA system VapC family ribonuclease toxin n=1 Tax=Aeromicrobium sp. TaxID=1871063 RepID=UPI0039E525DF
MTTPYLLDANVLIALTITDHEHHDVAARWAADVHHFALCPISEGALARFLIRVGESPATVRAVVSALHASPRCVFWPDSISYADAGLDHVIGHRQVTDAYLVSLAAHHGGTLATFDQGVASAQPEKVELISR